MSVVLTARDLTRHYEVSRGLFKGTALVRALNGVSFELEAGKTLAVVGESGCGKSTLARALTLIEEPSSGSLKIAGQEVTGASKSERKQLYRWSSRALTRRSTHARKSVTSSASRC
ncbi:Dipeptide transporter ATP-binding subunit [Pseudomonas savastanoi pv. glycinea]|nr:Dipeptide transporter ATP-binding subunit [Pseudomonas savastanoi pv. glycinea]